ncbi:MAG: hypothetical protein IJI24_09620, partial [Lachnospiraceae bacterium]|nr:hypothetical protein [Lachnospiraceae bacterium]
MKQTISGAGSSRSSDNILHISYQALANSPLDIGFKSIFVNGVDYHQVTRDITVSIQSVENHILTNTLYINGQPVKIQL